jgi:hypothetical protein
MPNATSLHRGFGKLTLPLSDTDETTLASLDPARDIMLALFAAAINDEIMPRWADAVAGSPLAGTSPVQDRLPALPDIDAIQQRRCRFPLLSVARSEDPATITELTLWQEQLTQRWDVDYILSPLTVGDSRKLGDILPAVAKVIALVIRQGGHRAYGPNVVFGQLCGFDSIKIQSFKTGTARFADDSTRYHALSLSLETTELETVSDHTAAPFHGASIALGTGDSTGTIPNLIEAET